MMKSIYLLLTVLLIGFSAAAQNATEPVTPKEVVFDKNEVSLTLGGSYLTKGAEKWGGSLGLAAFPFQKYLGVEASTLFKNLDGAAFDNAQIDGIVRLPLDKYRISLSAVGGGSYSFDRGIWDFGVGPQVEYRFNSKWGLRAGYRFLFENSDRVENNELKFGINLIF